MTAHQGHPSREYNERLAAVVKEMERKFQENPEQARKDAEESLTRMGLMENGKIKNRIVTRSAV